jgi:hypothetical protein
MGASSASWAQKKSGTVSHPALYELVDRVVADKTDRSSAPHHLAASLRREIRPETPRLRNPLQLAPSPKSQPLRQ